MVRFIAVTLPPVILVTFLAGASQSQNLPRACKDKDSTNPPKGLSETDTGVISRRAKFSIQTDDYWFQTFSDTAESGQVPGEQCFRYEVENTGSKKIKEFYWPIAGINLKEFGAGSNLRRSKVIIKEVAGKPIDTPTQLYAFETEKADSRAYSIPDKSATLTSSSPKFAALDSRGPNNIIPGFANYLQSKKLPDVAYTSYRLEEKDTIARPLHDFYSGPGFKIRFSSFAGTKDGKEINIRTLIEVTGENANSLSYSFPALYVVQKYRAPLKKLDDYNFFLSAFNSQKNEHEKNKGKWLFDINLPSSVSSTVYRMQHPVIITGSNIRECILVTSFSTIPINFDLSNCSTTAK